MIRIEDDTDNTWRNRSSISKDAVTNDVYEMLRKSGDSNKVVITEWTGITAKDRFRAVQRLRDAIKWRLKRDDIKRGISISIRKDGEVWVGWQGIRQSQE